MTPQIAMVLAILLAAIVLFVTERIRVDVVALMVLVSLALTGLVTPTEALSGFARAPGAAPGRCERSTTHRLDHAPGRRAVGLHE
jgi:di/tricarboxylate transporter